MFPLFQEGDTVYVNQNAYKRQFPEVDDIVIVRHPYQVKCQLIKQVVSIEANNKLFLMGLNQPRSMDSRQFGAVPCHYIRGKVVGLAKRSKKRATG